MIRYFKDGNYVIRAEQYFHHNLYMVNHYFGDLLTPIENSYDAMMKNWGVIEPGDYIVENIYGRKYARNRDAFDSDFSEFEIDYATYKEIHDRLKREEVVIEIKIKRNYALDKSCITI